MQNARLLNSSDMIENQYISKLASLFLGMLFMTGLSAQSAENPLLTKNFKFEDGVYLSYDSFKSNQPDYSWEQLKSNLTTNPQTFITQIEYIKIKDSEKVLPLEDLWGICLGGIPYIRLEKGAINKPLTAFAGIQLRGNICYFSYEDVKMRKVRMPVYNPIHKIPYQSAYVDRPLYFFYEKMLRFETGEIADLNVENLQEWIKDDSQLVKAVGVLDPEEVGEKLFKCLLIYDDRHLVRIGGGKEEENEK